MAKTSRAISVAELSENLARVVRRVRGSKSPVRVTEGGRTQAILLSVETYERNERERKMLLALARGEREMAGGIARSLSGRTVSRGPVGEASRRRSAPSNKPLKLTAAGSVRAGRRGRHEAS